MTPDIRPGDRITIRTQHGQERSGRVVMSGPYGWVLNMGGHHGTPAVASESNIVRVQRNASTRKDQPKGEQALATKGRV